MRFLDGDLNRDVTCTYSVMPIRPWPSGKVCTTVAFGVAMVGSTLNSVLTLIEVSSKSLFERTAIFSMK